MVAIPYRRTDARAPAALLLLLALAVAGVRTAAALPPLGHTVVWHEDDRRPVPPPASREPDPLWDDITESVLRPVARITNPGRLLRSVNAIFGGDPVQAAANVNALDEVPNSSWFTNRIGLFPWTPHDMARDPDPDDAPDRSRPFVVVGAPTGGCAPGLRVVDARGREYLVLFDRKDAPGRSDRSDLLAARILHAAGYWVDDGFPVALRPEDLALAPDTTWADPAGGTQPLSGADLEAILAAASVDDDGVRRGVARPRPPGISVGPFDWEGRRADDPNDGVPHQDRRELRAFRIFAAWLAHYDLGLGSTQDRWLGEGRSGAVRHYLRNFGSTLGTNACEPCPSCGYEYVFDLPAVTGRALALGLHEDSWRRVGYPEGLDEIGYFGSDHFDPMEFKPRQPNSAFANVTDRDGYWAAKIISAFTDGHLDALVASVGYRNPEAAEWMSRSLRERRDIIARSFFDRVPPLDFFTCDGRVVRGRDLAVERNVASGGPPRYRVRLARVDAQRNEERTSDWFAGDRCAFDLDPALHGAFLAGLAGNDASWLALRFQVNRGSGWSSSVTAYLDGNLRIVAVER